MATKIEIEQEDLDKLIEEVATELNGMLKSQSEELAKNLPPNAENPGAEQSEGSASASPMSEDSSASSPPEMSSASSGSESSSDGSSGSESTSDSSESTGDHMEPGHDEHQEEAQAAIEPAPTVEGLMAEYAKLPPEEMQMHYEAVKAAMMQMAGAAGQQPQAAPPAPAPAPQMPPPEMAMKAEMPASEGSGGQMSKGKPMKKSEEQLKLETLETELSAMKAERDALDKELVKLVDVLERPIRKSIKSVAELDYVAKEEKASPAASMSKQEVTQKLREKVRQGNLKKSDREAIEGFYCGSVDVSKVEHLLTESK